MDEKSEGTSARKLVSTCPGIAISFASNSDYAPMNLDVGVISREVYLTRSQRRMRIVLTVHIHARCAVRWKYILWKNWRGSFSTRANFYIFEVGYFHHGFPSFSPLSYIISVRRRNSMEEESFNKTYYAFVRARRRVIENIANPLCVFA